MRRIRRFLLVSMLGCAAPLLAPGDAGAKPVAAAAAKDKKAKPHRTTPVSAEHKKALAELYGGFKFGMTKDEVIAVFSKQLDERYDERIKATTDIATQDRLRREKREEVSRLQQSFISFDSAKASPWDVSIVEDEFAHNTNEAMLERWENQGGKNNRRFFFFYEGKLWKMFVSLDMSILPEDKRNFPTFQIAMEKKYGKGDVDEGKLSWHTDEFDVRAADKLKNYSALALVIEEPRARKQVVALREAKAVPPKGMSPVIKAVIDVDHKDHPDVKSNGNAVDDVIRAQGGTPGPAPTPPAPTPPKPN